MKVESELRQMMLSATGKNIENLKRLNNTINKTPENPAFQTPEKIDMP